MKGCPLACTWCHNPEGISPDLQVMRSLSGERIVGREYTSVELADLLNHQADILRMNEGGVTFSGGEPLMQAEFIAEVIDQLKDIHVVLDTSGYGSEEAFRMLVRRSNLVFLDLKIIDREAHRKHTGRYNDLILSNVQLLRQLGKPFHIRVPLVPGVTDTDKNLAAIAATIKGIPELIQVDLLPYNKAAGGKYEACGMVFKPDYSENKDLNINLTPFQSQGMIALQH
jgi:pyruvate formate lyase activating enzyme